MSNWGDKATVQALCTSSSVLGKPIRVFHGRQRGSTRDDAIHWPNEPKARPTPCESHGAVSCTLFLGQICGYEAS